MYRYYVLPTEKKPNTRMCWQCKNAAAQATRASILPYVIVCMFVCV